MKNTRQRLARSGKHGCSMDTGTGVRRAAGWDVMTRSADTTARDGAGFGSQSSPVLHVLIIVERLRSINEWQSGLPASHSNNCFRR